MTRFFSTKTVDDAHRPCYNLCVAIRHLLVCTIEMWLSLVERCVRDAEVAGSNPVISTMITCDLALMCGVVLHNCNYLTPP